MGGGFEDEMNGDGLRIDVDGDSKSMMMGHNGPQTSKVPRIPKPDFRGGDKGNDSLSQR
jgi:hypothetical protein